MKTRSIRTNNAGLTVKLNLWSLKKYQHSHDATSARHHIKGQALNVNTGKTKFFRDAGALLSTISEWNASQLASLKKARPPI